jgi:hypothetical protein
MRRLHLALAAILTYVAGFGKNVISLFGPWIWGRFLGIRAQPVKCFWENRSFAHTKSGVRFYFVAWE